MINYASLFLAFLSSGKEKKRWGKRRDEGAGRRNMRASGTRRDLGCLLRAPCCFSVSPMSKVRCCTRASADSNRLTWRRLEWAYSGRTWLRDKPLCPPEFPTCPLEPHQTALVARSRIEQHLIFTAEWDWKQRLYLSSVVCMRLPKAGFLFSVPQYLESVFILSYTSIPSRSWNLKWLTYTYINTRVCTFT